MAYIVPLSVKIHSRSLLRRFVDRLLSRLVFRRMLAKPLTQLRRHPAARALFKRLLSAPDPWAHVQDARTFDHLRAHYTIDFCTFLPDGAQLTAVGLIAMPADPVVQPFLRACEILGLRGRHFDVAAADFIDQIKMHAECAVLLCRPSHTTSHIRLMCREKLDAIARLPGRQIFPSETALRIYEAKRELAYFLKTQDIPHPTTRVFYDKVAALQFTKTATYPQVFKTNNGAGSSGVEFIYNSRQAEDIIYDVFEKHYINKLLTDYRDIDYGYVLLQDYVPNVREFRVIKIGDSWMGHEKDKLPSQEFLSGSGINKWTPPPLDLLDFCNNIAQKHGFDIMCFDVFLDPEGRWLVNELQTWFGSYNPSQMYINGEPCRYRKLNGRWVLEPGLFNDLNSLPLILTSVIEAARRTNITSNRNNGHSDMHVAQSSAH